MVFFSNRHFLSRFITTNKYFSTNSITAGVWYSWMCKKILKIKITYISPIENHNVPIKFHLSLSVNFLFYPHIFVSIQNVCCFYNWFWLRLQKDETNFKVYLEFRFRVVDSLIPVDSNKCDSAIHEDTFRAFRSFMKCVPVHNIELPQSSLKIYNSIIRTIGKYRISSVAINEGKQHTTGL